MDEIFVGFIYDPNTKDVIHSNTDLISCDKEYIDYLVNKIKKSNKLPTRNDKFDIIQRLRQDITNIDNTIIHWTKELKTEKNKETINWIVNEINALNRNKQEIQDNIKSLSVK